jgi:hypothetical protein
MNPISDTPDPRFSTTALYDVYRVTVRLRDKLCGGTPKNPELLKGWIAATTEHNDETTDAQVAEVKAALLEPTEEKSWNGFRGDKERGLFIEARQIKAMFKESATMLRITVDKRGSKQIFQHGFEIKSLEEPADRIYLGTKEPSGYDEGPIHVDTAQGPRTAIKRVDYIDRPTITFDIWVLATAAAETRHIGESDLIPMLTFAQENGLGADRSQGRGKFDVVKFEVLRKAGKAPKEPEARVAKGKATKAGGAAATADAE